MNGTKARMIRKVVYGDNSSRPSSRGYTWGERIKKKLQAAMYPDRQGMFESMEGRQTTGQIIAVGLRARYRLAKKLYKKGGDWRSVVNADGRK